MHHRLAIAAAAVALGVTATSARAQAAFAKGTYLYTLSSPTGPVPSSWSGLSYDPEHKEIFVVDLSDGTVGIFNEAGMEVYRFGADDEIGSVLSVAPLEGGDLAILSNDASGRYRLSRCNFRGEMQKHIALTGVPADIAAEFAPTVVVYRNEKLYLADRAGMKVVVADLAGACVASYDLVRLMKVDKKHRFDAVMHAFNVDAQGNLLFTDAPLFKVFIVSPDGTLTGFGTRGGSPGRFNIVGGIARDEQGRLLVTDILRSVVMVFDEKFEFLGEFGERGWDRAELIAPLELAVADGKVFVSQSARRGVSVFSYQVDLPTPAPDGGPRS